ncbi:hypothetical protein [Frankia sp. Cas3]|uniref:hypothetical protein n=1 Tax=Frankia sp. Cas3 TaxID=3073926 RepID=UPI002AD31F70|nr:hypothetical protein [Frankia sp. Cas3]
MIVLVIALLLLAGGGSACAAIRDVAARASAVPSTTGPPPAANVPPGPPLATASPPASTPLDTHDPASVAADCFVRWQSFDARADSGPNAGLPRARDCMTPDFFAQLSGQGFGDDSAQGPTRAWLELQAAGTRSTVVVLATSPLGGIDTRATGRVVLLLNVRRTTVSDHTGGRVETVSNPLLTLLRQTDGTWLVAAADLANSYGDAPGR